MGETRVVFCETRWWSVDLDTDEAEIILDERAEIIDVAESLERVKLAHPHQYPCDGGLDVERADESALYVADDMVLDGTKPPAYYWSARARVMDARSILSRGRYREGNCREMDAVNADLTVIEDRLRVLALAADDTKAKTDG